MEEALGPYAAVCSLRSSYDVPFSPDGSVLALVRGSKVVLWSVEGCAVVGELRFRYGAGADFSPDGRLLAVLSTSGALVVHRASDLELVRRFSGRGLGEGAGPLFAPDGDAVIRASWNGDLVAASVETGEVLFRERGDKITQLACSPDRTTFAYASHADENDVVGLRRWPFSDGPTEDAVRPAGSRVSIDALALGPDGLLAVRTYDRLAVWQVGADEPSAEREMEPSGRARAWRGCRTGSSWRRTRSPTEASACSCSARISSSRTLSACPTPARSASRRMATCWPSGRGRTAF